jgi:hypothetical protein
MSGEVVLHTVELELQQEAHPLGRIRHVHHLIV